jgi:hypothetical protein
MRTARGGAILLVLGVAGLSACGGGVSKSAFLKKADGQCRPRDAALTAIAKPSDYPSLAEAAATLARTNDEEVASVRKLSTPGSDKERVRNVLDQLGAVSASARTLEAKARAQDAAAGPAAADTKGKGEAAGDSARLYGFTVCGTGARAASATIFEGAGPIIKKAYIAKGEAACASVLTKLRNLRTPTDASTVQPYLTSLGALLDEVIAGLDQPPPPGDEATVNDILAAFRKEKADVQTELEAARRGDQAAAKAAGSAAADDGQTASSKARAYGFTSC